MDLRLFVVTALTLTWMVLLGNVMSDVRKVKGVRFLVSVNDTWADPPGCIATVSTDLVKPNVPLNQSRFVFVGKCDHGPLLYTIRSPGVDNNNYTLSVTFHSSVIEDASPPSCDISWNGTYLVPKPQSPDGSWTPDTNLLPSCFTMESREGYHMTYYWFYLLEWQFG